MSLRVRCMFEWCESLAVSQFDLFLNLGCKIQSRTNVLFRIWNQCLIVLIERRHYFEKWGGVLCCVINVVTPAVRTASLMHCLLLGVHHCTKALSRSFLDEGDKAMSYFLHLRFWLSYLMCVLVSWTLLLILLLFSGTLHRSVNISFWLMV